MKIFEVVADGNPGGGTTVVLTLVEGIYSKGVHEIHLVTQTDSYAYTARGAWARHGLKFFPNRFNSKTVFELASLLKRERPDIVHAHGARAAFNVLMARKIGAPEIPLIYTVHGYQLGGRQGWIRKRAAAAERWCHAAASMNVFVSDYDCNMSVREGYRSVSQPAIRIPNGLQLDKLPKPTSSPNLETVAFLGRVTRPKNPMILVDIAECLKPNGYRLKIIGGGDMESQLRKEALNRKLGDIITITGSLPREVALNELRTSGAMVLPSLWEGLPVSVIEAMAMRVPVVASAVCGIPEIVRDEETGILVRGGGADEYAKALRRLTSDLELRKRVLDFSEVRVKSDYQADVMVNRYLAVYHDAAERRRKRVGHAT